MRILSSSFIVAVSLVSLSLSAAMKCDELFLSNSQNKSQLSKSFGLAPSNVGVLNKIADADIAQLEQMRTSDFLNREIKNKFNLASEKSKLLYYIYRSAFMIENINETDPQLTESAVRAYLSLHLFPTSEFSSFNLTDANGLKIRQKAIQIIEFFLKIDEPPLHASGLESLVRLIDKIDHPSSRRLFEKVVSGIGTVLENNLRVGLKFDPEALNDLIIQSFNKMLGRPYKKTFIASYAKKVFYFLSTDILSEGVLTERRVLGDIVHGYYTHGVPTFGKNLVALTASERMEVNFIKGRIRPMMNVDRKRFPTAEMWKDRELVGAVVIGEDMSEPAELAAEYKAYYKNAGFSFKKTYRHAGFTEFFEKLFTSGRLDYFLKEDSGGSTIENNPWVVEGRRMTSKGIERVYIVYTHSQTATNFTNLSSDLVGNLINKSNSKALVYLNTTCSSFYCQSVLVEGVTKENFTYVAPTGTAQTFANEKAAPIKYILDGIRLGHDYAKVKANIDKNRVIDAETLVGDNLYVLPHTPEARANISEMNAHDSTFEYRYVDLNGNPIKAEDFVK